MGSVALAFIYFGFLVIALFPVLRFDVLPLGDMPNHLARAHILANLDDNSVLQKYYATDWRPYSFQLIDVVLPPLSKATGPYLAAQIFVATAFVLLILGTASIHRVLFGTIGVWPVLAFLFLYNLSFIKGQISFLFSLGLALLLFAGWIATSRWNKLARTSSFAIAALALSLCHLFAFACYAITVVAHDFARPIGDRRGRVRLQSAAIASIHLLAPVALFALYYDSSATLPNDYGPVAMRPIAMIGSVITYFNAFDMLVAAAVILILLVGVNRNRIRLQAPMLFPVSVLFALALAMPHELAGVLGADQRLPCWLGFLLVGSSELITTNRKQVVAFVFAAAAILAFRVATLSNQWSPVVRDYQEFRETASLFESGSRIMIIPFPDGPARRGHLILPYWFVPAFAVIERDVFLPQLYTMTNPMKFSAGLERALDKNGAELKTVRREWTIRNPEFQSVDEATIGQVLDVGGRVASANYDYNRVEWSDWPEHFDYAVELDLGNPRNPVPALLSKVWQGSYFTIYRIHGPMLGQQ